MLKTTFTFFFLSFFLMSNIFSISLTNRDASWLTKNNPVYKNYDIGEWTYGAPTILFPEAKLKIGRFCSIAGDVKIMLGGEHRSNYITTYPFHGVWPEAGPYSYVDLCQAKGDVIIGNDVWIASDVLILSGVTIGNGAIIGARSLVTKDVPAYAIVGGCPAKFIRFRFPEQVIEKLEAIAWWNWPEEKIVSAMPLLLSGDLEAFITKYGS